MFFANPVAAFRNVRLALEAGSRFVCVVWRRKVDNPWLHVAEEIVKPLVDEPEEADEARSGPGPFSQANADTLSGQLLSAGLGEITLRRHDVPIRIGRDLDEAVAFTSRPARRRKPSGSQATMQRRFAHGSRNSSAKRSRDSRRTTV